MTQAIDIARRAIDRGARIAEIRRSLELLHNGGDVYEVRALDVPSGRYKNVVSGYFNNDDLAAAAAEECDFRGAGGVYVTINPVAPALLARRNNRCEERPKETTKDEHISRRHWLPIDVDSDHISGISATEEEKQAARDMAAAIEDVLRSHGFPFPLLADSGNGAYLFFRTDLPNDAETAALLKAFLESLARAVPWEGAHIDQSVYNASRIMRIGGTWNRKGDSTPDRPHRQCHYRDPIPECPVDIVPVATIRAFVEKFSAPRQTKPASNGSSSGNGHHQSRLSVGRWLSDRGISFRVKPETGATAYIVGCPFGDHGGNGETAVHQADSGKLTFECKHNSCQNRRWADYRDAIGKPDANHYDPPLNASGNQAKAAGESSVAVKCRTVEPGTILKATDKGENFGTVVVDNGPTCTVHFVSPEGQTATKEIDKRYLFLQDGTPLASGGESRKFRIKIITSAELASTDYTAHYYIEDVQPVQQPTGNFGQYKSLKSSFAVAQGISIASGKDFLGRFKVPRTAKVLIDNGESGFAALKETAERICKAQELDLASLSNLVWSEDLPRFDNPEHLQELESILRGEKIEVYYHDCAYLSMSGENAHNVFSQGELLRNIAFLCRDCGTTLVLLHHARKTIAGHDPPELSDAAWSGFAEFVRSWILIGRREKYVAGTGEHKLWLSIGGSLGHQSLLAVDVAEGLRSDPGGRRWEVTVQNPDEARQSNQREKDSARIRKLEERDNDDRRRVLDVLRKLPEGATKNQIRDLAGVNGKRAGAALTVLIGEDRVETVTVTRNNRPETGYRHIEK